jgi:hypothetical protein
MLFYTIFHLKKLRRGCCESLGHILSLNNVTMSQCHNEIIESVMVKPEYSRNEKMDFKTKVKLAISIGLAPCFEKHCRLLEL